jgi:hypothetical protein
MALAMVIYKLECEHYASAPATLVSGKLYCGWHDGVFSITGVLTEEWRVKCTSCRYARFTGTSQESASLLANSHVRRNSWHRPFVDKAANPDAVNTQRKFDAWANH